MTIYRSTSSESMSNSKTTELEENFAQSTPPVSTQMPWSPPTAAEPLTPWKADAFAPLVTKSGALKLAKTGIAPLVVAARRYESVDGDCAKSFAKNWNIGDGRSKRGTQFLSSFRDDGDVLVMPWYRADTLVSTADEFVKPTSSSLQMRPSNPRINEKGKSVKYEFLVGQDTVLDYHPATTRKWIQSAPRTIITEGLLKGDAALTAQLRQYATDEELSRGWNGSPVKALAQLAELMDRIPQHERVAVLSIAGVGNWRSNPEWNAINFREKEVWIAFDGDVNTNWNVWNMGKQLFEFIELKKGSPRFVLLSEYYDIEVALAEDPHLGLDDFFHSIGTWADLEDMLVDGIPERPQKTIDARVGEWRVSPEGTSVEECVAVTDAQGNQVGIRWDQRCGIGGRVTNADVHRAPSEEEMDTGKFGAGVAQADRRQTGTYELRWFDEDRDRVQTVTVEGPQEILYQQPSDWSKHGVSFPEALATHPDWTPRNGKEWLKAIKSNAREAQEYRTFWRAMGWVPVEGESAAAFIVGDTVIAPADADVANTRPGIVEQELAGASRFGLADVYRGVNLVDPNGEEDLADDVAKIFRTFITESPWQSREVAATVLALALRPTVPIPTSCSAYFVGAPGKGKSWTARQVMSFWQRRPGTWEHTLPGSAADTFASTENAVAVTPIWVVDDLAPSSDARQADSMEARIGDLIRAVFNKLGKRRMNANMTAKSVPTPKALLIVTAENEPTVQSIRERTVGVEFTGLSDDRSVNNATSLANTTLTASRVTAAVIRLFIINSGKSGWAPGIRSIYEQRKSFIEDSKKALIAIGVNSADVERPAGIAADLGLGLEAFKIVAEHAGLHDIAAQFTWDEGGLFRAMVDQVAKGHLGKSAMQPGTVLIDCVRQALMAGYAHLANADKPGLPPDVDGIHTTEFGWEEINDEWRGRGPAIGFVANIVPRGATASIPVLFLNTDDAFRIAQEKYEKRILHGSSPSTSWKNARDIGHMHPHYSSLHKNGYRAQFTRGNAKFDGFPIAPETLYVALTDQGTVQAEE